MGPSLRRGSVNKSSMALTMALSGAAVASMRRPPGARKVISASSAMAATARASSQRPSRLSRSASSGARSSVSPSTSMPRLSMNEPSRGGWRSAPSVGRRGPSGSTSSRPCSAPVAGSITSRQRSTATLWWAKPGCTTMRQPRAWSRGTCSAQKSPKCGSSGSDHSASWPTAASLLRHCSACSGSGRRPVAHSASRASASAARSRCSSTRWFQAPRSNSVGLGRVLSTRVGAGVSQCRPWSVV